MSKEIGTVCCDRQHWWSAMVWRSTFPKCIYRTWHRHKTHVGNLRAMLRGHWIKFFVIIIISLMQHFGTNNKGVSWDNAIMHSFRPIWWEPEWSPTRQLIRATSLLHWSDLICLSTPSSTAHKDKDGTRNRVMNSLVACDTNALFSSMAQLEWKWPKFSTVYRCRTSDLLCN